MAHIDTSKLTSKEKRELIEQLEIETRSDETVKEKLNDFIDELNSHIKWLCTENVKVGEEPEQAVNSEGEPLFKISRISWNTYTADELNELSEEDRLSASAYHKPVYEEHLKTYEELEDYEQSCYEGYQKLIKLFNNMLEDM